VALADSVASLTMQLDALRIEVACMHGVAMTSLGHAAGSRLRAALLASLLPTAVTEGSLDSVIATLDLLQVTVLAAPRAMPGSCRCCLLPAAKSARALYARAHAVSNLLLPLTHAYSGSRTQRSLQPG
jgi:hypothetical protein